MLWTKEIELNSPPKTNRTRAGQSLRKQKYGQSWSGPSENQIEDKDTVNRKLSVLQKNSKQIEETAQVNQCEPK